jgi:hypothetical protein
VRYLGALLLLWSAGGCGAGDEPAAPPGAPEIILFLDENPDLPSALVRSPEQLYYVYTTTLFLNVDGPTIQKGAGSDAPQNLSFLCGGVFPPFDHSLYGADRNQVTAELAAGVQALFADFNVEVVTARPSNPPYDMVVVGGTSALCGYAEGLGGLGPVDCDDALHSDIAFAFSHTVKGLDMLAVVIAHEAAHAYGLLHTLEPCDVMSNFICTTGSKTFMDREMAVAPDHLGKCGASAMNSWQTLNAVLGPHQNPGEDRVPPIVRFEAPKTGQGVASSFEVRVDATDNVGVTRVELLLDGTMVGERGTPPYTFVLAAVAEGSHTLTAAAYDAAGNRGSDTVSVMVGTPVEPPADGGQHPARDGGIGEVAGGGGAGGGGCAVGTVPVVSNAHLLLCSSFLCFGLWRRHRTIARRDGVENRNGNPRRNLFFHW